MARRRRSSYQVFQNEVRRGEPGSRRNKRLPPTFRKLDSPIGLVSREARQIERLNRYRSQNTGRDQVKRLPAKQVERNNLIDVTRSRIFEGMKQQSFCHKRQQRKEVLFAKNIAGHSGRSPGSKLENGKKYLRTVESNYSCRR